MAFGSTLAREESFPESVWHERAAGGASGTDRVTLIAERDGKWVGLASGIASADPINPPVPVLFSSGCLLIQPSEGTVSAQHS
jgi:hypothetical protein